MLTVKLTHGYFVLGKILKERFILRFELGTGRTLGFTQLEAARLYQQFRMTWVGLIKDTAMIDSDNSIKYTNFFVAVTCLPKPTFHNEIEHVGQTFLIPESLPALQAR